MYKLRDFQEKAVSQLLDHCLDAFLGSQIQTQILLESPTGSGKTVMMSALLERIMDEVPLTFSGPPNIACIWIAPNTLHLQSYKALHELYSDTKTMKCVDLSEMSSNPILSHRQLLFVNWSKLDSEQNLWRRDNEYNTNLQSLIENTRAFGTKIVLVVDEAHIAALVGPQAIAVRNLIGADIEILVTATPTFQRPQRTISISRYRVVDEEMIKKAVRINIGLSPEDQNGENVHIQLLRTAFKKKQELQDLYNQELGVGVLNPLVLIQLPSENPTLSDEDKSLRITLEALLAAEFGITSQNGRLAVWLSGEREKDGLEDMNGLQDVLIFKQAVAQGWDCPRASILVSYRKVNSAVFGIQTVGRILRMPHQRHYQHDSLNYGYVYSNIESNQISFQPDENDYFDLQIAKRRVNEAWNFDVLQKDIIVNDRKALGVLTSAFDRIFFRVMEDRYSLTPLPDLDLYSIGSDADYASLKESNRVSMSKNFWEFDVEQHFHIATNLEVDSTQRGTVPVQAEKFRDFSYTATQYSELFDRLCYDSITRLNRSKSWKKMKQTLFQFAEFYLGMFENDARKFCLYAKNKQYLIQDISTALERFDEWQKSKGNKNRRIVETTWEVPNERYYSDKYTGSDILSHAMEPFFEYTGASNPEKDFRDFLIQNEKHIEWWYKNGDSGKEHFSVHYKSTTDGLRLFFIDFVIKLRTGTICLFDTKTKGSDPEATLKHNALLDYIEKENSLNASRRLIGGILIPEVSAGISSFRYPKLRISDTSDLTGWIYLNFNEIDT